jgi:uncharacterized protein (TIGR03435 family)
VHRRGCIVAVAVSCGVAIAAQSSKPAFEVASVKRNLSGPFASGQNVRPGGVFSATNQSLERLIQFAYGIDAAQLEGGPGWVREYRYDVSARAAGEVPIDQLRLMVQSLVEDRFRLRVRREQREMPILELRTARSDGRVGPNLHDCSNSRDTAGISSHEKPFTAPPGGSVSAGDCASLESLARMASRRLQTTVVDKTGLKGQWRYDIYYGPDLPAPGAGNPDLPSFVGALREQLGLRLERASGTVEVLVIDSVQEPTED